MPSTYGFVTEQEKKDARRKAEEAVAELVRSQHVRNKAQAEAIFGRIWETVRLILTDFAAARELTSLEFIQDSLSITVIGTNLASDTPQAITIKVHVPLDRGYVLYLCRPMNWDELYGREELLPLAQVLADNCNIETGITITTTESKRELTQADTYITIPAGEHSTHVFHPMKIRVEGPYNR